jgi:hypothetical protein
MTDIGPLDPFPLPSAALEVALEVGMRKVCKAPLINGLRRGKRHAQNTAM